MPKYMVERHLPGLTDEQLGAAAARAKQTTTEMAAEGTPVRYLRSTFVPGEEKCYCLFEGPSEDAIQQAQERAQLPYQRIVEAQHIAAEDVG